MNSNECMTDTDNTQSETWKLSGQFWAVAHSHLHSSSLPQHRESPRLEHIPHSPQMFSSLTSDPVCASVCPVVAVLSSARSGNVPHSPWRSRSAMHGSQSGDSWDQQDRKGMLIMLLHDYIEKHNWHNSRMHWAWKEELWHSKNSTMAKKIPVSQASSRTSSNGSKAPRPSNTWCIPSHQLGFWDSNDQPTVRTLQAIWSQKLYVTSVCELVEIQVHCRTNYKMGAAKNEYPSTLKHNNYLSESGMLNCKKFSKLCFATLKTKIVCLC